MNIFIALGFLAVGVIFVSSIAIFCYRDERESERLFEEFLSRRHERDRQGLPDEEE